MLKAGVDIRGVSKALGHSSVLITERYYVKWNKAQQDILDGDLARAWGKAFTKSRRARIRRVETDQSQIICWLAQIIFGDEPPDRGVA